MPIDPTTLTYTPTPNPWCNRGTWCFSIIKEPVQRLPYTHSAFAERVDEAGNYRGIKLGPFKSRTAAEQSVVSFKPPVSPEDVEKRQLEVSGAG